MLNTLNMYLCPVILPIPKKSNMHVSVSEMYCNIDIDTECRKILSQYQYLT